MLKRTGRFLINYWIVLLLFVCTGMVLNKEDIIPQNLTVFLGNFLLYNLSYNSAWWYVLTYMFLIFLQPMLCKFVKKSTMLAVIMVVGAYIFGCGQRFYTIIPNIGVVFVDWIIKQVGLLAYAVAGYTIGALFAKKKYLSKIKVIIDTAINVNLRKVIYIFIVTLVIVVHAWIQSVVFAIFSGVIVICIFSLWDKSQYTENIFIFLGKHSTNIWLVHMFFYGKGMLFENLVFRAKYPVLIFFSMMLLCIAVSYVILTINRVITVKLNL